MRARKTGHNNYADRLTLLNSKRRKAHTAVGGWTKDVQAIRQLAGACNPGRKGFWRAGTSAEGAALQPTDVHRCAVIIQLKAR